MTSRERFRTVFARQIPDRVPMVDISFWPGTVDRWREEGLPEDQSPQQYFGLDTIPLVTFDSSFRLPEETLEETDRWRVRRNSHGVTIKEYKDRSVAYAPPSRLDSMLKTWDDWRELKPRLQVDPERIGDNAKQHHDDCREQDLFVVVRPDEPMWYLIEQVTGFERGLPMLAGQPDLAGDILNTCTDFILGMCDLCVEKGLTFDGMWFFSDLCYRNGMLFSPKCYRELLLPCHRRVKEWCTGHGDIPLMIHCDGNMTQFIPLLMEGGFDCVQPLEARCGNDVRELKKQYGTDIVFFGNIGTDVMARGDRDEIREEVVSKVTTAKEGGGYIYHCDHSVPPTVSFESYSYVIELVREFGKY